MKKIENIIADEQKEKIEEYFRNAFQKVFQEFEKAKVNLEGRNKDIDKRKGGDSDDDEDDDNDNDDEDDSE